MATRRSTALAILLLLVSGVSTRADGVTDDPLLRRFTGIRVVERSGGLTGSQPFFFQKVDVSATVTVTGNYVTTTTERSRKKMLVAFRFGDRGAGVYCEAVSFGEQDEEPSVNPWAALGAALSRAAVGGGEWSGSSTSWLPFNPGQYAEWMEKKWLPWRRAHLRAAKDPLAEALALCEAGRAREARAFLQAAVQYFGYETRKSWGGQEDPAATVCYVPELFAWLGDIERADGNWAAAEELYRIACSNPPPFLDDVRGIALAHRGYGYTLAHRAQAPGADTQTLGRDAALHLRAYLGYYGDREAPDKGEIMKTLAAVDPGLIRRRQQEAEAEVRYQQSRRESREFREQVRETMEY